MIIKKYTSLCKKDYKESDNGGYDGGLKTYLFKGEEYEVHEEHWGGGSIMRKAIIPPHKDGITDISEKSYVGFLSIPFFDYFYTTNELRDLKLKEIGIYE
jgi:hypothetical protein